MTKVVITAAGKGTRLLPFTKEMPKEKPQEKRTEKQQQATKNKMKHVIVHSTSVRTGTTKVPGRCVPQRYICINQLSLFLPVLELHV